MSAPVHSRHLRSVSSAQRTARKSVCRRSGVAEVKICEFAFSAVAGEELSGMLAAYVDVAKAGSDSARTDMVAV